MSALASLKRNWLLATLVLLCALTVFAAFVAPAEIGKMELEQEASTAASRIGAELNQEPSALIDAFELRIAPHFGQISTSSAMTIACSATSSTTPPAISSSPTPGPA